MALLVLVAGSLVRKEQDFPAKLWRSPAERRAAVSVELDADPGRFPNPLYSRERGAYGLSHLEIPVRLVGPRDAILLPGTIAQAAIAGRAVYAEVRELPPGQWWLSFDVPAGYFNSMKIHGVAVEGGIDLTLFRGGLSLPAPRLRPVPVPGVGVCRSRRDFEERFAIECFSPAPNAALALEFPGGGRHSIISRVTADVPLPLSDEFTAVSEFSSPTTFAGLDEIAPLRLVTEVPSGHIRERFRFSGLRLADFVYPRTYRRP